MPKPINIATTNYSIAADKKSNSAEIKMYGEVVEKRPTDWWTGEPIEGDFIIPSEFIKDIEKLGKCKRLNIRLNSIGGEVHAAILIHNRLREMSRNGTEITCSVDGVAMSAGSMIMCAADHVSVSAESLVMIHKSIICICSWLNADTLRDLAERSDSYDKVIVAAYKRKTGLDEKELLAMMTEETYLTGEEAKEKGFADEVYESENKTEIAACADKSALVVNGKMFPLRGMPCPGNLPVVTLPEPQNSGEGITNIKTTEGGNKIMASNFDELLNENPTLAAAIEKELTAKVNSNAESESKAAATAAIEAERKRLAEIDEISAQCSPEMVKEAKYGENACTAQELAYRMLQENAKKGKTYLDNVMSDSNESNVGSVQATPTIGDSSAADTKEIGLSFMDSVLAGKENA
ncbi:MAG: Clp protease ClpP [Ruminococcaceae bacterium]|nr:Clp protease ClpP [Oscillospiraceae bacterium]